MRTLSATVADDNRDSVRFDCGKSTLCANKTLKQPETVLAFAHPETEIKQNCRLSAETKQATVGS